MAETRQNRLDRELDTRSEWARPDMWRAPETLPQPNPRPGWSHRYIRVSMLGTPDPSNISGKLREGYEPVKADEYPELMVHAVVDGRFKGNIEIGGLVLCRIPAEFMTQRDQHYAKLNQSQIESVDNNYLRNSDPKMPMFADRKSKVTFGSGS
jgi:hypothetical protein